MFRRIFHFLWVAGGTRTYFYVFHYFYLYISYAEKQVVMKNCSKVKQS